MTREEAVKEIEKAFEPAFANYIITALTEGATVSDKEPATKNDCAEQNGCITCSLDDGDDCCRKLYEKSIQELLRLNLRVDCISRQAVVDMTGLSEWFDSSDSYNEFVIALSELPSVTPQEPILDKIRAELAEYGSIMVAYAITKNTKTDKGIEKLVSDVLKQAKKQVLAMIDKYKAESEEEK